MLTGPYQNATVVDLVPHVADASNTRDGSLAQMRGEFETQGVAAETIAALEGYLAKLGPAGCSAFRAMLWTKDLQASAAKLKLTRRSSVLENMFGSNHRGDIAYSGRLTSQYIDLLISITQEPSSSIRIISVEPVGELPPGGGKKCPTIELKVDDRKSACSITPFMVAPSDELKENGELSTFAAPSFVVFFCGHGSAGTLSMSIPFDGAGAAQPTTVAADSNTHIFISYAREDHVAFIDTEMLLAKVLAPLAAAVEADVDDDVRKELHQFASKGENTNFVIVLMTGLDETGDWRPLPLGRALNCASTRAVFRRGVSATSAHVATQMLNYASGDRAEPAAGRTRAEAIWQMMIDLTEARGERTIPVAKFYWPGICKNPRPEVEEKSFETYCRSKLAQPIWLDAFPAGAANLPLESHIEKSGYLIMVISAAFDCHHKMWNSKPSNLMLSDPNGVMHTDTEGEDREFDLLSTSCEIEPRLIGAKLCVMRWLSLDGCQAAQLCVTRSAADVLPRLLVIEFLSSVDKGQLPN